MCWACSGGRHPPPGTSGNSFARKTVPVLSIHLWQTWGLFLLREKKRQKRAARTIHPLVRMCPLSATKSEMGVSSFWTELWSERFDAGPTSIHPYVDNSRIVHATGDSSGKCLDPLVGTELSTCCPRMHDRLGDYFSLSEENGGVGVGTARVQGAAAWTNINNPQVVHTCMADLGIISRVLRRMVVWAWAPPESRVRPYGPPIK